ncbi:hypothetical protein [Pseudogulbenkiania ferrooxidans]|uniref:Uncharacterized protein n=1 Tax=Pseudogulbenkiania ferrooxidans 2002 TaxID=279714 RepID=B9Z856_9NEIS|nr:hypothetical protein [Pseudogulbenkiania ferrooxidans]EEG07111.1 hypothetical protein FuraDRAFT_3542 [Pseudogulbenkiania ferrooxidans 2002]
MKLDLTAGSSTGEHDVAISGLPKATQEWIAAVRADQLRRSQNDQNRCHQARLARSATIAAIVEQIIADHFATFAKLKPHEQAGAVHCWAQVSMRYEHAPSLKAIRCYLKRRCPHNDHTRQ